MSQKGRDPKVTHKIMSAIPSKNTEPELMLRKALWKENLRYRVNYKKLPGKPDIAFTKYHVAVFCDGDYWHGHNWAIRGLGSLEDELADYTEFWRSKILRNIERDEEVNQELKSQGWVVIRLWESDIRSNLAGCVETIKDALSGRRADQSADWSCRKIKTQ